MSRDGYGSARLRGRSCGPLPLPSSRVPVTALVDQFYADVQGMGGNRWDTSSLIKRLK